MVRSWGRGRGRSVALMAAGVGLVAGSVGSLAGSDVPLTGPLWQDATASVTGVTEGWTNKVEVADVDGDGLLDILHANGGLYDEPGPLERQLILANRGDGTFEDITDLILGPESFHARVVKVRDVTGDAIPDVLLGTTYSAQTRLFKGLGTGSYQDLTPVLLPAMDLSVGDLEVGDVDGDLDIDIVLADWGPGSPMTNSGAPVRLWRNSSEGFSDDPDAMPTTPVGFSWDLELVDVDLDWDLDIAVSCKQCQTSRLYLNDGTGTFTDVSAERMPAFSNNYEFEPMDLDGDGDPELVTINDGERGEVGFPEHVFRNDDGFFTDVTAEWWPATSNPGWDDNVVAFLDADSDGDADFVIGSLDGPDRLLRNDGAGGLTLVEGAFAGAESPGTLGLALGDLDGDARLDVVEGAGEVTPFDHVYLATDALPPDTAPPTIAGLELTEPEAGTLVVRARVHDRKTPVLMSDFTSITAALGSGKLLDERPMASIGSDLWAVTFEFDGPTPRIGDVTICATDRAGNEACTGR